MTSVTTTTIAYCWPLASAQPANSRPRPTWAEWCTAQQRRIACQRGYGVPSLSVRELAHLEFMRWLAQTGRIELEGRSGCDVPTA